MPSASPVELTPAQRRTLDVLGAAGAARPVFPEGIGARLRADLEAGLAEVVDDLAPDEVLAISKHKLAQVHACEARLLAEEADDAFEVTIPIARGTVAEVVRDAGLTTMVLTGAGVGEAAKRLRGWPPSMTQTVRRARAT